MTRGTPLDEPEGCPWCDKRFLNRGDLRRHARIAHLRGVPLTYEESQLRIEQRRRQQQNTYRRRQEGVLGDPRQRVYGVLRCQSCPWEVDVAQTRAVIHLAQHCWLYHNRRVTDAERIPQARRR